MRLLAIAFVGIFCACKSERPHVPELAIIHRVEVLKFPEYTLDGNEWDGEHGEERPDISITLTHGQDTFSLGPLQTNAVGELVFNSGDLPITLNNPQLLTILELFDEDKNGNDAMGKMSFRIWSDSSSLRSKKIRVHSSDRTTELELHFTLRFNH
ncbi:MAG: hypothetical protein RL226_2395 [Bacteroidota bacterium]